MTVGVQYRITGQVGDRATYDTDTNPINKFVDKANYFY